MRGAESGKRRGGRTGGFGARGAARAAVCVLALALAPLAQALTVAQIKPAYFDGPGGFGFSQTEVQNLGLTPAYSALPTDFWLTAGAPSFLPDLSIQELALTVHQNPQARGATPSFSDPLIADSDWRVRNDTSQVLANPLLVFTSADASAGVALDRIGLDVAVSSYELSILAYSSGGIDYRFGVLPLPTLAPGDAVDVRIRYVVAAPMPIVGSNVVIPALKVAGLASPTVVPEPATVALLGLGLVALAGASRRWR